MIFPLQLIISQEETKHSYNKFSNNDLDIELDYPKNWSLLDRSEYNNYVFIHHEFLSLDLTTDPESLEPEEEVPPPQVAVIINHLTDYPYTNPSLEFLINSLEDPTKTKDEYSESTPISMKIGGRGAIEVEMDIPQEERKVLNIYTLNNEGIPIIISYMANNLQWDKYYPVSKKIIDSIRFIP
jgi:hypothetical protein